MQAPSPPSLSITVGDIARIVNPRHVPSAIERLRHLTREGLLQQIETEERGTGHHRRYHPQAAFDALVLCAIADMGLHVTAERRTMLDAATIARGAVKEWRRRKTKGPFNILIRYYGLTEKTEIEPCAGAVKHDAEATTTIIINISQILARLENAGIAVE